MRGWRRKDAPPGQPRVGEQGAAPLAAFSSPPRAENFVAKGFGSGESASRCSPASSSPPAPALGFAALHNERELAVSIQKSGKRNVDLYFRRLARKKMPCASPWLKLE